MPSQNNFFYSLIKLSAATVHSQLLENRLVSFTYSSLLPYLYDIYAEDIQLNVDENTESFALGDSAH